MCRVEYTNRFKKDLKRCEKRGLKLRKLLDVVEMLANFGELPNTYRPHKLSGNKSGYGNVMFCLIGCWFGSKMTKSGDD